ncbi:unnamed protein product, partial [Didymodactylos carnosus]
DGVVTPNQNISLWPFILMINEVPIPQRRYTENIIIAGVIPAKVKPNNIVFEACLDLITEDLQLIENGQQYYISDLDATDTLHFFTIASCTDKPAEALMENVVVYNAEYGCPKCFTPGEIFHGERGLGNKIKKFHIRVFPYGDIEDRTQDKCTEIVRDMEDEKLSKPHRGHSGRCQLTRLRFFKYGSSFLTDSLHTIYSGAFKKLCDLLFHKQHKKQKWSLHKKIKDIDDLLQCVRIPSTTSRRFRTISIINKFKGSEYRSLFHFGFSTILLFVKDTKLKQLLLSFVTAVNLALSDLTTIEIIQTIKLLSNYFVQSFEAIFGKRHMVSNIHSLLHLYKTVEFIGPIWMCSTFNFEDLIAMVHGTTEYAKQIIKSHTLFRHAIISISEPRYPLRLLQFNEQLMNRKTYWSVYHQQIDDCLLSKQIDATAYDTSTNGLATYAQRFFKDQVTFHHSVMINNCFFRTTSATYRQLFGDCCISFDFGSNGDGASGRDVRIRPLLRRRPDAVIPSK